MKANELNKNSLLFGIQNQKNENGLNGQSKTDASRNLYTKKSINIDTNNSRNIENENSINLKTKESIDLDNSKNGLDSGLEVDSSRNLYTKKSINKEKGKSSNLDTKENRNLDTKESNNPETKKFNSKGLINQGYMMDRELIGVLALYAALQRGEERDKSAIVRNALRNYIPKKYFQMYHEST